ncbi:WXG100 family type VII secretion target [Glycomyces tenuis]|uniref:WXG100 family type VII secretion target n=1 Tax=Glycomyces tenuis TaxID=58116 RepID=UPI000407BCBD|nr:WXG100 family type VII secretion target [Glycomyces tenuis]
MPSSPYELHGNVPELQNLAQVQHTYRGRFESILGQIQGYVGTVKGQWVGAGTEGFAKFNTDTEAEFTNLQTAFNRLATATDTSATNWQAGITRITNRWGG